MHSHAGAWEREIIKVIKYGLLRSVIFQRLIPIMIFPYAFPRWSVGTRNIPSENISILYEKNISNKNITLKLALQISDLTESAKLSSRKTNLVLFSLK